MQPFSGAYPETDIQFLLRPIAMAMTDLALKEELIQSGKAHYSDLLSQEAIPSPEHLSIYRQSLLTGAQRLATDVLRLAKRLMTDYKGQPIVLVSLVRAGVPLGVMLTRALRFMGQEVHHYGISIIRDRGIDTAAMDYIEARHSPASVVFVDGWVGKGAITNQLTASLKNRKGYAGKPKLVVLADPCGVAWLSASNDDWLIPFGILGANVSGLISRSVWSADDFHGCVLCSHLADLECGVALVDQVQALVEQQDLATIQPADWVWQEKTTQIEASLAVIKTLESQYAVDSLNRIKPGIAEATRAVLRRVPDHVLVRSKQDPDVKLLVHLAVSKGVHVEALGDLLGPYRAVTIIKKVL